LVDVAIWTLPNKLAATARLIARPALCAELRAASTCPTGTSRTVSLELDIVENFYELLKRPAAWRG
jgi:hypothetical protein